jgi:hypothetical protein
MKTLISVLILLFAAPAWAADFTVPYTTLQLDAVKWACTTSSFDPATRDPDGDGVFTPCTNALAAAYFLDRADAWMNSYIDQYQDAVVVPAPVLQAFKDADLATQCSILADLGEGGPGSVLPKGVCP